MYNRFFRSIKKRIGRKYKDIDPEDIFLDSANLPGFTENRFEGRIERPIESSTFFLMRGSTFNRGGLFFHKVMELGYSEWRKLQKNF